MYHECEDAHLGGTAIVQLLGAGGLLLLGGVHEAEEGDAEVPRGRALDLLPHLELPVSDGDEQLEQAEGRNGGKTGETVGDAIEGGAIQINGAGQVDSSGGGNVSHDGKHGNTSVLDLSETQLVKALLISVLKEAKRIPEAKRRLSTHLSLEGHLQGRRGAAHAGGSKAKG